MKRRCRVVAAVVAATTAAIQSGAGTTPSAPLATAPIVPVQFEAGELAPAVSDRTVPPAPPPTAVTAPPPKLALTPPRSPAPRRAAAVTDRKMQVIAILDTAGWDWRGAGVTVRLGDQPDSPGHWGVYDSRTREVWVGRGAFAGRARLRYVVLHEAAHAWQYTSARKATLYSDLAPFGLARGEPALEAGADCVATLWGATRFHYWNCPATARSLMARRLAGDWF